MKLPDFPYVDGQMYIGTLNGIQLTEDDGIAIGLNLFAGIVLGDGAIGAGFDFTEKYGFN